MARIRHIALLTKDTEKLADFYKTSFGLNEVARSGETGETAAHLSFRRAYQFGDSSGAQPQRGDLSFRHGGGGRQGRGALAKANGATGARPSCPATAVSPNFRARPSRDAGGFIGGLEGVKRSTRFRTENCQDNSIMRGSFPSHSLSEWRFSELAIS